jgi:hypothetical protein
MHLASAASAISKRAKQRSGDPRVFLWKVGGIAVAVFLTFLIMNFIVPVNKSVTWRMLGLDFLAFYYGGTCARTGQYDKLYDLHETKQFEYATGTYAGLELGTSFGPWWNPPFAAWMFAPLSALPYLEALHIWWSIGLICLIISIVLLCRMIRGDWQSKLLVPWFMLTTMPFFQAVDHGQNTFFSLLLLTIVVVLWRGGYALMAGLVCGLLFYKPQLGAIVAIVLSISQGRRALLGVALMGTALLLINVITMPGTLHEFVYHMPVNLHWELEENHYHWDRHITFKGFWRLLFQYHSPGPTAPIVLALWGICEAALVGGLLAAIACTLKQPKSAARTDRLIAATIVSMPLLMPFYFDYDLLLISIGAVLYAADRQRSAAAPGEQTIEWEDRWLPRAWVTLYIVIEFGTALASLTRVQPVVLLVAVIAALLIRRTLRPLNVPDLANAVARAAPTAALGAPIAHPA